MKKNLLTFLIFLTASGCWIRAQDLEKILMEHYSTAAQEKMANMETLVVHGRTIFSSIDLESPFIQYRMRPDKIRIESKYQQFRVIQTYDGENGWIYAPGMGIEEAKRLAGEELHTLLNQAEFENPLWDYEAHGRTIELISEAGNSDAHQLKCTMSDGNVIYFLIDRETYLISSYITRQVMGGTENEIEVIMDKYRSTKGIPVAREIQTRINGEVVTTVLVERVEFNRDLDPALFEKPVSEAE
jgi:outer membrane lipoprotein-sorting protein